MIKTGFVDPINEEFGIPQDATNMEKTAAILGRSTKTFTSVGLSTFAAYNLVFLFGDLRNGTPIKFKENAKMAGIIGLKVAAQDSLTCIVSDSIAMCRGSRKFYDPIIGGAVAGATVEVREGWKAMGKGAFNGAMTQTAFAALSFAFQKINEKLADDDE